MTTVLVIFYVLVAIMSAILFIDPRSPDPAIDTIVSIVLGALWPVVFVTRIMFARYPRQRR